MKNSEDKVIKNPSLVFTAADIAIDGKVEKQTTIDDLEPGEYTVEEISCDGLVPSDNNTTQLVNLNLPTCSETVTFENIGNAVAKVNKVTVPGGLENGWEMLLKGSRVVLYK